MCMLEINKNLNEVGITMKSKETDSIKSCRFARECVSLVHECIDVTTQLHLCLYEQTQIIVSATCRVGSQEFLS